MFAGTAKLLGHEPKQPPCAKANADERKRESVIGFDNPVSGFVRGYFDILLAIGENVGRIFIDSLSASCIRDAPAHHLGKTLPTYRLLLTCAVSPA
jgi:hypothetical protein